jgi:hypothetical protein
MELLELLSYKTKKPFYLYKILYDVFTFLSLVVVILLLGWSNKEIKLIDILTVLLTIFPGIVINFFMVHLRKIPAIKNYRPELVNKPEHEKPDYSPS